MVRLLVVVLAAFASVSVVFFGVAQDEVTQIGVGTPVTWSVDGTPVESYNVVAIVDKTGGGFAFAPDMISIPVGGTVVWRSQSSGDHTVASTPDNGATFNSGGTAFPIMDGQTYANVFTTAGTITYKCEFHPSMTGTIRVNA